jgi:hypothetical protein
MINGNKPKQNDPVTASYKDWLALLDKTGNKELLDDPFNVWIEAFHVGTMLDRASVAHAIQTQTQLITPQDGDVAVFMSIEDVKQLQLNLLKQVLEIVERKEKSPH